MAEIIYSPVETAKAHERRVKEGFFEKYVDGFGLDIGCGYDPLNAARSAEPGQFFDFPLDVREYLKAGGKIGYAPTAIPLGWDMCHGHGDAHLLEGIPNNTFDYVHSSHLLEHLEDPVAFLRRAFEVLKPGGFLLLLVPHRDRYENRRLLPSRWNEDHKSFWLPEDHDPPHTWSLKHVLRLAGFEHGRNASVEYVKTCDEGWTKPPEGVHAGGEYSIEAVVRKL